MLPAGLLVLLRRRRLIAGGAACPAHELAANNALQGGNG
jgi:hypothetical protein